MCYSAMAWQEYKRFLRDFEAHLGIRDYVETFWDWANGSPYKIPRAMQEAFRHPQSEGEREVWEMVQKWRSEQAPQLEQELFKQTKRRADAGRTLATKTTKKAQEDLRISTNKIAEAKRKLADLSRTTSTPDDSRIFPDSFSSVMIVRDGRRVVVPMRYHCRPFWMPASSDRRQDGSNSGKYNARRDKLEQFWGRLFGHQHAVLVADRFYEHVEGADGKNRILEFEPRTGEPMLVACLWSHWTDPAGNLPNLTSFAAITDEPEPEVAATGHDRTIINLRPEHLDAWLNPDPKNLGALYALFEDKRHPYYEHREAA